jgi:hypothetical protein
MAAASFAGHNTSSARMACERLVDGFTRPAPNLWDRCGEMDGVRRDGGSGNSVGGGFNRRALRFTIGEGADDDRYLRKYVPAKGFSETERIACPEFTGSYLSFDGDHLYLSQWYKHRILKLDASGDILRVIDVGAEICGHVFVDGLIYVLRGTEQPNEDWRIARVDPQHRTPKVEDLARVPFPCRSLAFDGANFWTNHRVANEIVSFALPD